MAARADGAATGGPGASRVADTPSRPLTTAADRARMSGVTTPFDDPQAELGWMFVQSIGTGGDLDEAFSLVSDDFSYWSNVTGREYDATALRRVIERIRSRADIEFHLIRCLNEAENTVIEAQAEGTTADGRRYDAPLVFLFDTHDGLITSLREYGDTQLARELFGPLP